MSAAAVIALRRKRLIRAFREAGATDCDHASTLEQVGQRHTWIFDQLVRRGVFVAAAPGRYFLDERAADAFLAAYRKRALVMVAVLLVVGLLLWLLGVIRP